MDQPSARRQAWRIGQHQSSNRSRRVCHRFSRLSCPSRTPSTCTRRGAKGTSGIYHDLAKPRQPLIAKLAHACLPRRPYAYSELAPVHRHLLLAIRRVVSPNQFIVKIRLLATLVGISHRVEKDLRRLRRHDHRSFCHSRLGDRNALGERDAWRDGFSQDVRIRLPQPQRRDWRYWSARTTRTGGNDTRFVCLRHQAVRG